MKKVILIASVFVALLGCKDKAKQPISIKSKTDSIATIVSMGYVMKDSTGAIRDSVLNNNTYLIYNYKKVPMGIYKAEVVDTISETSSYISGAVFIDRKLIYSISVVQPLTHYGDNRIWHFTNKD